MGWLGIPSFPIQDALWYPSMHNPQEAIHYFQLAGRISHALRLAQEGIVASQGWDPGARGGRPGGPTGKDLAGGPTSQEIYKYYVLP